MTNNAQPRYATQPNPDAGSWADAIFESADALGTSLMPWQADGARLLGELSDELCRCHEPAIPLPRYKTVAISVPRQQGKTTLSYSVVDAAARREDDQDIFVTNLSRDLAADLNVIELGNSLPDAKTRRGKGQEDVTWPNGSVLKPVAPDHKGGHGRSIHFMLVDEGWNLQAELMGGISPAMMARPHSQMLIVSTMGTIDSVMWNGFVESGREGDDPTMAYVEYSAPSDHAVFEDTCERDGEDGCVWGTWMPALGVTVSHADIRSSISRIMKDPAKGRGEVVRAYGNRTTASLVTLFPADQVEDAWRVVEPPTRAVVAVDVNESPPGATVSVGYIDTEDRGAVRTMEWRYGSPRWVPEYVEQMLRREDREVEAVVVDLGGPARVIRGELTQIAEDNVVALVDRVPRDYAADCQNFYDALRERTVALEKSEALQLAIESAVRKDLGTEGLWVVSRKSTVDASPLIAAILAHGLARELDIKPKSEFFMAWV